MTQVKTIGIIGAGAIGSALSKVFQSANLKVVLWDKDSAKCTVASLDQLVNQAQLIILCVPSWVNVSVAQEVTQAITNNRPKLVVTVAKGVDKGFKVMPQVLEVASKGKFDYGVLYGPMLAEELTSQKHGAAILACNNSDWNDCLDLSTTKFKLEYNHDPLSVALCGSLKNIYALALGIHDGLQLGDNSKGQLAVMCVAEMKALVKQFGGQPEMVDGLAGLGDLLATGWSEQSFNHRIGKALAEGILDSAESDGEGVRSLKELDKAVSLSSFPIATQTLALINEKISSETWSKVLD